ncbi:hypothetical protein KBD61_04085 [Patescibacteria group bacterium]|nr:hypothetical protein [Patescibacteria group bacterium]MBP9710176.1 hypothetical protein [Patescibacteria group bacterium]
MQIWMARTLVAFEVVGIGVLAYVGAHRAPPGRSSLGADMQLMVALLLVLVCSGLFMKIRQAWSTRMLWEWMFVGMGLLGAWMYPRWVFPGGVGMVLGAFCAFLPFFWSTKREIRLLAFWVGAAGAALLLASSLQASSLWVLFVGFCLYDGFATRSAASLAAFLRALSVRRGVSTELVSMTGLKTEIWPSYVILPAALVAQAVWRAPVQGVVLLLALLIGAWYAIMRAEDNVPLRILPWAMLWMLVAQGLLWWVS